MPDIIIRKKVKLPADHVTEVALSPTEYPSLSIHNPYCGGQTVMGNNICIIWSSHSVLIIKYRIRRNTTFGIRKITNEIKKIGNDYGRVFIINGQRIFCKGGWLQPDALQNLNEKRVYDEARLMAKANVNMVAVRMHLLHLISYWILMINTD